MNNLLGINWKIRLKNPHFYIQLFISLFATILGYYGIAASQLTTFESVWEILGQAFSNPYVYVLIVTQWYYIIVDPTSAGVTDSKLAQGYEEVNRQ